MAMRGVKPTELERPASGNVSPGMTQKQMRNASTTRVIANDSGGLAAFGTLHDLKPWPTA